MPLEVHHLASNMRTRCHFRTWRFPFLCEIELQLCVLNLKIRFYSWTKFEVSVISAFSQYKRFLFPFFFCVCVRVKFQAYQGEREMVTILIEAPLLGFHRCNCHPEMQSCLCLVNIFTDHIRITGAGRGCAQPDTHFGPDILHIPENNWFSTNFVFQAC